MKEEIMRRLGTVLTALNSIYVSGKGNLANLANSIFILEDTEKILEKMNITAAQAPQEGAEEQKHE